MTTPFADGRVALASIFAGAPERDALVNQHVVADLAGFTDHHAHAVIDEENGRPMRRARMNFRCPSTSAKTAR